MKKEDLLNDAEFFKSFKSGEDLTDVFNNYTQRVNIIKKGYQW